MIEMQPTSDVARRQAELDKSPDIDLQRMWDKAKVMYVFAMAIKQ